METWKSILRQNFTHWHKLANYLELSPEQCTHILAKPKFPLSLPLRLAKKIEKRNLADPILRQFLPTTDETKETSGFLEDPVGDQKVRPQKKYLKKYESRALVLATGACAMHCRYCFRQNLDYEIQDKSFDNELLAIAKDTSLREIILSGGDPLSLSNRALGDLLKALEKIPHIKRIRFHSRFPIGIPERIDEHFLEMLRCNHKQFWFIIHTNHPKEMDEDILHSLKQLQTCGIPVLNQAVLLKGVNDSVSVLKELCENLADHGIFPYYLHQLDRVQGASHFEVPEATGKRLVRELAKQLSGYAVPKYVKEESGAPGKTILS